MLAYLVVNAYLHSEKFNNLHNHLVESAKDFDIDLRVVTNENLQFENDVPSFVLFWDKDTSLARKLEGQNIPVFNSSKAIELCDNKAKTYLELEGKIPMPKTYISPLTFFDDTDFTSFVEKVEKMLNYPIVFKECFGSFGEQVFLCKNRKDVLKHITSKPFILQEYIASSKGHDVRLEVVGDKVVCAMERFNNSDFRSNITNGGKGIKYEPTNEEKELAINACKLLGLTFGGVDILDGNILCEVNSNAHIMNMLEITNHDCSKDIFKEILKRI